MINNAEEYNRIKAAIAKDLEEHNRVKGRISMIKEELKKHGVSSKAEATAILSKLEKEINKSQTEFDSLVADFEKKYGQRLQNLNK